MKLYYTPGTCALAAHIILEEAGLKYETVAVDLRQKTCSEGDYNKINPKGYVPALKLDNGELLTEDAIIMQYLADQHPEKNMIPKAGSMERYRLLEMVHFISTEIHKGFGILFAGERMVQNAEGLEQLKAAAKARLGMRLEALDHQVAERKFLMGDQFTIADAYMVPMMSWAHHLMKSETQKWPKLNAYFERLKQRPSVQKAMMDEGLLKK